MSQKEGMFSSTLKKVNGSLVHVLPGNKELYKKFVDSLEEGQTVGVYFEANKDDGTIDQLAKVHKCIRLIADETGEDFETIKHEVKMRSGLCINDLCKSFAVCSKEELSGVIQTIIKIGDFVNLNLR